MNPRFQDWQIFLGEAVAAADRMPFAWGTNDCCLFVADCIRAMTGTDLGASFRGKYDDPASAMALIAFATDGGGVEQLVEQLCRENDMGEVEVAYAQRGDIALHDVEAGPAAGIIYGDGALYLSEALGLVAVPRASIRRAWRV